MMKRIALVLLMLLIAVSMISAHQTTVLQVDVDPLGIMVITAVPLTTVSVPMMGWLESSPVTVTMATRQAPQYMSTDVRATNFNPTRQAIMGANSWLNPSIRQARGVRLKYPYLLDLVTQMKTMALE